MDREVDVDADAAVDVQRGVARCGCRPRPPRTSRSRPRAASSRPSSRCVAACSIVSSIAWLSMKQSAMRCPTAWNVPIARSNCLRSVVYSRGDAQRLLGDARRRSRTMRDRRAVERRTRGSRAPCSSEPSSASSPTRTPSSVHLEQRLVVHRLLALERDARRRSVGHEEQPRRRRRRGAGTSTSSAAVAPGTLDFTPSSRQPSPSRVAVVVRLLAARRRARRARR